jgi:hypothetical protein
VLDGMVRHFAYVSHYLKLTRLERRHALTPNRRNNMRVTRMATFTGEC